jgi:hypothetical protein
MYIMDMEIYGDNTITLAAALSVFVPMRWPSRFTHRKFMADMGNTHNIS